jgi:hypothetical protein
MIVMSIHAIAPQLPPNGAIIAPIMVAVELWDSPSKYHTQESISANDFTILL